MAVTVAISTFGGDEWRELAGKRAGASAKALGVPVVFAHADTLHAARNAALAAVETEWVIFLDADDQLDAGYLEGLAAAPDADLIAPAVRYVRPSGRALRPAAVPRVWGHDHDCEAVCLAYGNWMVIGTAVRAGMVRAVGGWRDWPAYEDWDLWARCWLAGATAAAAPEAIYIAHVRPESRNRAGTPADRMEAHRMIARDLGLPVP